MTTALAGLRVLDFTSMLAGPFASRMLADLGAEVIKVEPADGDHNRARRPLRDGWSSLYGHLNCGKKSVVLDLKSPSGVASARALARRADVALENWRPGVAERLGVGFAALAAEKPDIVYCSISGYGQGGPLAQRPAYAPIIHATSGYDLAQIAHQQTEARAPATGTYMADVIGGYAAFGAVMTALFRRERTGAGQFIDVALLDGMLGLLVFECQAAQFPDQPPRVHRAVAAADGYVIATPTSQKNFEALARAIGHSEWLVDPRFANTPARERHWQELMALFGEWTRTRGANECEATLLQAGVPCSRYRRLNEALADPHLASRGTLAEVRDGGGAFLVPNPPFRMAGLEVGARGWVAALGEHTDEVMASLSTDGAARCED